MLRIERIEDADRLNGLRREWGSLLAESAAASLFLTWEWLRTWWRHLGTGYRLQLLALRRGDELIGLAPFARRSGFAGLLPRLGFLGTGTVGSDDLDLIVKRGFEAEALQALAGELGRMRLPIELRQLPAGRALGLGLMSELRAAGWAVRPGAADVCPFVDLAGHTWESYLATLGREHRANVRRRLRQLEREGVMRLERAETEEQRARLLAALFELHDARWRARGGSEAFGERAVFEFHDEVTRLALEKGWLRLIGLTLDGGPAAVLYGFRYAGRFLYYQLGWDARLSHRSVGLVMLGLAIRSALEEGAVEFDFLHGGEGYKFLWTRQTRALQRLEAFPPSLRGRASRRASGAARACRSLAREALGSTLARRVAMARRAGVWEALRASITG